MVEQLKEVLNEMQILMLNCCEEEPLGKRPRKEERKKKKRVSFDISTRGICAKILRNHLKLF